MRLYQRIGFPGEGKASTEIRGGSMPEVLEEQKGDQCAGSRVCEGRSGQRSNGGQQHAKMCKQ